MLFSYLKICFISHTSEINDFKNNF